MDHTSIWTSSRPLCALSARRGPEGGSRSSVRGELFNISFAHILNQPNRYGSKDKRPLDPPPVARLRIFELLSPGTPRQAETEVVFQEYVVLEVPTPQLTNTCSKRSRVPRSHVPSRPLFNFVARFSNTKTALSAGHTSRV